MSASEGGGADSAADLNERGIGFAQSGETERALAAFTRAIEVSPETKEPYNNRGNLLLDVGQPEQAGADYSRAIVLDTATSTPTARRGRDARGGLERRAERRVVGARAVLPEARDRDHDESRVALAQRLGGEAQAGQHAWREACDERVGALEQAVQQLPPLGAVEVERDRARSRLPRGEGGRAVPGVAAAVVAGGEDAARALRIGRALDLDDVRAEVGERAGDGRPRPGVREVDDPQALEERARVVLGRVRCRDRLARARPRLDLVRAELRRGRDARRRSGEAERRADRRAAVRQRREAAARAQMLVREEVARVEQLAARG